MREAQNPPGVSFVTPATTPPDGAPAPNTGTFRTQFGVESNQVREDGGYTGLSLEEKAQLDLAGKVAFQRVQAHKA